MKTLMKLQAAVEFFNDFKKSTATCVCLNIIFYTLFYTFTRLHVQFDSFLDISRGFEKY